MSFEDTNYFFGRGEISTLTAGDALGGGDVVSGFECMVAEIFE